MFFISQFRCVLWIFMLLVQVPAFAASSPEQLPEGGDFTTWFRDNSILSEGSVSAGFDMRWVDDQQLPALTVHVQSRVWASDAPTREQEVALRVLPFEVTLRVPLPAGATGNWAEIQYARAQLFQLWMKQMGLQIGLLQGVAERLIGVQAQVLRLDIFDAEWNGVFDVTSGKELQVVIHGSARLGMLSDLQSQRADLAAIRALPRFAGTRTTGGLGFAGKAGAGIRLYERVLIQAFGRMETSSTLLSDHCAMSAYGGQLEVDLIPGRFALTGRFEEARTQLSYRVTRLDPPTYVPVAPPPATEAWEGGGQDILSRVAYVGLRFTW